MTFRNILLLSIIAMFFINCVEELDSFNDSNFENLLVIDGRITNELKNQEILLSRTYKLSQEVDSPESNANVRVRSSAGVVYHFQESITTGKYISSQPFSAEQGTAYKLEIETTNGKQYVSAMVEMPPSIPIDSLYTERGFNENNEEGVSIFIDAAEPSEDAKYYRFEFEETYKIIAPLYSPKELIIQNDDFPYPEELFYEFENTQELIAFFVISKSRDEQKQVCYKTVNSNTIINTSTIGLTDDKLGHFRVRFINMNDHIIRHRYSIKVRQIVQSEEAYIFFDILNNFSIDTNLFSQIQSGFLEGNVLSVSNSNEKVAGYFEVISVDEKRLFFNYEDVFPDEEIPPFIISCHDFETPSLWKTDFAHNIIGSPLQDYLNTGWVLYEENFTNIDGELTIPPFTLVLEACGDCTTQGVNYPPNFWID